MALSDKTEPKPAWKLLGQRANGAILQKSEIRMGTDDRLPELRGRNAITRYITGYYSELRPHWYNGGLTPNESERLFYEQSTTVANFS